MSGLTLTISRDKEVLVLIGAGGDLLVNAEDSERRALFAKLQYALMTVADLDGPWRQALEKASPTYSFLCVKFSDGP